MYGRNVARILGGVPASTGLARALEDGNLIVLAGAGLSKLGPSFLPGWLDFNKSLLDEAKACAIRGLPGLSAAAVAAIESLDINQVPVEAFSDLLVRSFASDGYFTVLDVLDADRTNANHQALAALAKRGRLKSIVTTNFDTLFERAFRDAGVPLTVLTSADVTDDVEPPGVTLYKIHGSVTAASTLVDTVSQKMRGLPERMRARLGVLYGKHYLLVLGFSGGDLKFGRDYLMLSAIDGDAPGFTWVVHPKSEPAQTVANLKQRTGDKGDIVKAVFPDYFATLGVEVSASAVADADAAQREVERRTVNRIRRFFDEPYVGPLSSAAFCAGLLARLDHVAAAADIRQALADEAERWQGRMPKTAAAVLRTVATGALDSGDLSGAERWVRLELRFWSAAEEQLPADTPLETRTALWRNTAATYQNLAVVQRARGALDEAGVSIVTAAQLAEQTKDPGLISDIQREMGRLAHQLNESADVEIGLLRKSISFAVADGSANRIAESRADLADTLIQGGEYLLAWRELDLAAEQLPLAVNVRAAERIELLRAEIEGRRGQPSRALARLTPLVERRAPDTAAGARVRVDLAQLLGASPSHQSQALGFLDEVLVVMAGGRLPASGLSGVPNQPALLARRATIAHGGKAAIIELIRVPATLDHAELRGRIVLAEFAGLIAVLPSFYGQLCRLKMEDENWPRVMDAVQGLYLASNLAGDEERRQEAIALDHLARVVLEIEPGDVAPVKEVETAPPDVAATAWMTAEQLLALGDVVGAVNVLRAAVTPIT